MNEIESEIKNSLPKIAVVVPCYNSRRTIVDCINGLIAQDYPSYEIIVIDDNSTDGTADILQTMAGIKVIRNKENRGPSYSRNRGIEESSAEIILMIDSDSLIDDRRLILKHVLAHSDSSADIIGGGIEGVGKGYVAKSDNYSHWFLNIPYSSDKIGTHLVTNNISIKRDIFERLGGFNIRLKTGEDTDFCERARKAGYRLGLKTDIVVKHCDRERFKDFIKNFYLVGIDRIPARMDSKHRYWLLLPFGFLSSLFYCFPLAFLLTLQVLYAWLPYDKKVFFYFPLIFMGRLAMTIGIIRYYFYKEFKKLNNFFKAWQLKTL